MTELEIPEIVDDHFRDHYRELILGSIKRTVEVETVERSTRVHRIRRRKIERSGALLGTTPQAAVVEEAAVDEAPVDEAPVAESTVAESAVAPPPVDVAEVEAPPPAPAWPAVPTAAETPAAPAWPAVPAAAAAPAARALPVVSTSADALIVPVIEADPRSRARLRLAIRIVWVAALVLLICDVAAFGLESWATGGADIGLILLTLLWFVVTAEEVAARSSVVLDVPEPESFVEPNVDAASEASEAAVKTDEPEAIEGVRVRSLRMQRDAGGHVSELFGPELLEEVGFAPEQWQMHVCRAGTLRGMHAHARRDELRIVVEGRVALGLKDLREGSPTEGRSELRTLSGDDYAAVVIPAGVAYGIYAQTDAHVLVGATADDGSDEYGCAWNDPGLEIEWPGEPQFLSERDRKAGPLAVLVDDLAARAEARSGAFAAPLR